MRSPFRTRHRGEVAEHQPRWKCPRNLSRAGEANFSRADSAREADVAEPYARHGREVGIHVEIDLESGILYAEIGLRALEQEPEQFRPAAADRHAVVLEAHHDAPRRQAIQRNAPAHIPHQKARIQVVALDSYGPALSPRAQPLDYRMEFASCFGEAVAASPVFPHGFAHDHAASCEAP